MTSIRRSGADFAYLRYVNWHPIAFSFMLGTCMLGYPLALAIEADTFAEYIISGFHIKFCDEGNAFVARKLIGFTLVCEL